MNKREGFRFAEPGAGSSDFNFQVGPTYVMTRKGWRRVSGWFGLRWRARQLAYRLTRWWRPRMVCTGVNRDDGFVTLTLQRWSWTRWRWLP